MTKKESQNGSTMGINHYTINEKVSKTRASGILAPSRPSSQFHWRIKGVKSYFTVKDFTPFLCVTGRIPDFLLYGLILVVTDPQCYNNV